MKNSKALETKPSGPRLNIQRTIWIGLAFFGILLVWQFYKPFLLRLKSL